MTKSFQLLALDLDDTLLNKQKEISLENKHWVSRAINAGVIVIFTTGRGIQRVAHLRKELKMDGPMVLVNGAEVWKDSNTLLERRFIHKEDIRRLYKLAIDNGTKFWGYSVDSITKNDDWTQDMFNKNWLKFGLRHPDISVINQIRDQVKKLKNIEMTNSATTNIEISFKGTTKEYGVKRLCEELDIPLSDIMAIGDNMNDYQLIKSCGFGVAMGNAVPKVKEVADAITDSNENNGVALAIKNYLLPNVTTGYENV